MSYSIDIDPRAQDTIAVLPAAALLALAEAMVVLELVPWSGRSVNPELNPDAPVRNLPFGVAGILTHLIIDHDQRVDVLLITWSGWRPPIICGSGELRVRRGQAGSSREPRTWARGSSCAG